jgi:elongation factor Ts
MAEITAATVKELRDRTGLPMMDCKKALDECDGDSDAAVQWLRERGAEVFSKRADRSTDFGRFGITAGHDQSAAAMVELKCESAPVTQNEEFIQLAEDLAVSLAQSNAGSVDELLSQPSPSAEGVSLGEQKDDLFNRTREVFNIGRMIRIEGTCGGYSHNSGTVAGVLLEVEGGNDEAARDICMHIAAMRPEGLTPADIPAESVEQEREVLRQAALQEGKPENIVDKMVEGRLKNFFAGKVLSAQPFVKDDKLTVEEYAEANGMKLKQFIHWEMGAE